MRVFRSVSLLGAVAAAFLVACASATPSAEDNPPAKIGEGGPIAVLLTPIEPSTDYPLRKCVVMGDRLVQPRAYLYGGREVQFCCSACAVTFAKDPAAYLAKQDAMIAAQSR